MALIKCPDCGTEVSEAAQACIKCGRPMRSAPVAQTAPAAAPAKKTGCGTKALGCLVILIILSGIGRAMRDIENGRPPAPQTAPEPGTGRTTIKMNPDGSLNVQRGQPAASEKPAFVIGAADLVAAYEANEIGADARYKDRLLGIDGIVATIGKDIMGTMYVAFESGNPGSFRQVQVYFDDSHANQLAQLVPGQRVRVTGRCTGLMGNVLVKDGRLTGE